MHAPDRGGVCATLFKPFAKSADVFGFGLGLAIAERATSANGDEIMARNGAEARLEMVITVSTTRLP